MKYGSEAIIQRIGLKTNRGVMSTPLSANMQVKYNLDSDRTLLQVFSDWADEHDHKVLMPFSANCSLDALRTCDTYIALTADGQYLMGRIVACGESWEAANPPHTPYHKVPDGYMASSQLFWLALDDVEHGDAFDFTHWWMISPSGTDMVSLEQAFKSSKVAMMYATRLNR